MYSLTEIEAEIRSLQDKIDDWEEERKELESKLEPAKKELQNWISILQLRQQSQPAVDNVVSDNFPDVLETPNTAEIVLPDQDEYGGKGETIRQFIISSSGLVSAGRVRQHLQSIGLPVSQNYIYKVLGKLVEEGLAEKIGSKIRYTGNPKAA